MTIILKMRIQYHNNELRLDITNINELRYIIALGNNYLLNNICKLKLFECTISANILKHMNKIEKIYFSDVVIIDEDLHNPVINNFTNVHEISLLGSNINCKNVNHLQKLKKLLMLRCPNVDEKILLKNPQLKILNLYHINGITNESFKNLHNLRELTLDSNNGVTSDILNEPMMANLKNLNLLDMEWKLSTKLYNLNRIHVLSCNINDDDFKFMPNLNEVNINRCDNITGKFSNYCPNITKCFLNNCDNLSGDIRNLKNVEVLYIMSNKEFSDDIFKDMKKLTSFTLDGPLL